MKILISAAEASSDTHGAHLLRALREAAGTSQGIEAFGVGGPALEAEGLRKIVDARELLSMGFLEVLARLPRILKALKSIALEAEREKPDLAVVIDYPEFHFRLAKRLKRLGIPVVYYIPPKVWVWRKGRLKILRERFAAVLSILPFEVPFYREAGVPVKYVGNPVVDELSLSMTREEARKRLGIADGRKVLVLMPGSRPSELKCHTRLMLEAARVTASALRIAEQLKEPLCVLIPLPLTADLKTTEAEIDAWKNQNRKAFLEIRVFQGNSSECMVAGDAGLVKSGTSTLEAGVLGLPHAVVYRPNGVTAWLFENVVRYRGPVGLVNLVANGFEQRPEYLMKEILCKDATAGNLAKEALSLFMDHAKIARIQEGVSQLRKTILIDRPGTSPSRVAAEEVLRIASEVRK